MGGDGRAVADDHDEVAFADALFQSDGDGGSELGDFNVIEMEGRIDAGDDAFELLRVLRVNEYAHFAGAEALAQHAAQFETPRMIRDQDAAARIGKQFLKSVNLQITCGEMTGNGQDFIENRIGKMKNMTKLMKDTRF